MMQPKGRREGSGDGKGSGEGSFRGSSGSSRGSGFWSASPPQQQQRGGGRPAAARDYVLAKELPAEDIVVCLDVCPETGEESGYYAGGRYLVEAARKALLVFVHAKHTMNRDHRFAFAALAPSFTWVFIYSHTSIVPRWNLMSEKLFTFDVMYLHGKPKNSNNSTETIFEVLSQASEVVSQYPGYTFENTFKPHESTSDLNRDMCILLSHPVQRCLQDDIDYPKKIKKGSGGDSRRRSPVIDYNNGYKASDWHY